MTTLQEMLAKRRGAASAQVPKRPRLHFGHHPENSEPPPAKKIHVVILTYDRPTELIALLADIHQQRGHHDISVTVYDDASRSDYAVVRQMLAEHGWSYVRARQNHGKRGFWRWVNRIYQDQKRRPERLFVMLPDDVRLCERFFDRALTAWIRIKDPTKVALNLLRDSSRDGRACWTHQRPIDCGHVFDIGWVDGAIFCNRNYFKALAWRLDPVDPARWSADPLASSGVGQQISLRLQEQGLGMYGVKRSLTAHVLGSSKMNPVERRRNPLVAVNFIDGEKQHRALVGDPPPRKHPTPISPKRPRKPVRQTRLRGSGGVKKIK